MASLENALQALFLAGGGSGRGRSALLKSYSSAVSQALDSAADAAVEIVQESLSEPNIGASSRPGEPPRMRTGTLMRSIHWRRKQGSRFFPAPNKITREAFARFKQESPKQYRWYKSIRNDAYADPKMARPYPVKPQGKLFTRVIEVSPRANDRSDRQRLEYYSYFLESGWWSVVNPDHLDKGYTASDGLYEANELPAAKANPKPGMPVYNPRRPYLSLLQDRFASRLLRAYRKALVDNGVPEAIASQAGLKVTFELGRRVPFYRENK